MISCKAATRGPKSSGCLYPSQKQITDMMNLIERSDIHPIIARKYTMEHIADAHMLAEQRGLIGKIVVTV